jgi:hypothetical protein
MVTWQFEPCSSVTPHETARYRRRRPKIGAPVRLEPRQLRRLATAALTLGLIAACSEIRSNRTPGDDVTTSLPPSPTTTLATAQGTNAPPRSPAITRTPAVVRPILTAVPDADAIRACTADDLIAEDFHYQPATSMAVGPLSFTNQSRSPCKLPWRYSPEVNAYDPAGIALPSMIGRQIGCTSTLADCPAVGFFVLQPGEQADVVLLWGWRCDFGDLLRYDVVLTVALPNDGGIITIPRFVYRGGCTGGGNLVRLNVFSFYPRNAR